MIQAQGWGPQPGEPQVLGRGVCLYGWGLQGGRRAGSRQVHLPMTRGARPALDGEGAGAFPVPLAVGGHLSRGRGGKGVGTQKEEDRGHGI